MPSREYRDDTVTSTTRAFEATTLGATASSQPQRTARTGYPPVAPSTYQPPSTGSDEPITGDLHHPTGPGSSRSSNPGPYRNVFTDSAQRRRRDPANPGNIQGSSRESGEEDEDEGEDEGKEEGRREKSKAQGKEKEEKKGKEKGKGNDKRKGSGTPEAPPPRKLPYDPTKDRD